MIRSAAQRTIFRWIHIVFSIPIIGYIYSRFEKFPTTPTLRGFSLCLSMILTGVWMWKGHVVRRLQNQ